MKKHYIIAGIALLFAATNLQAQSFNITYDFASVTASSGLIDPTPVPTATGVTFGSFAATTGMSANPNASVRFSFTTNALGGINLDNNFANFTGTIDLARYYEVTLVPISGFTLNIDTIAFTIQRSGTGIRNYAVRGSDDGFGANLSASISPANVNLAVDGNNAFQYSLDANANAQNGSLISLGAAYDALTSATTFRFYGWNAEALTGTFSIDNVNIVGSVTPVPEPSIIALAALGGGACLLAFRRKR